MVTGPFFSDSSKDRRLQSVGPSSISSCERCSADGISASLFHRRNVAFSLTSEINRVSVVAPGRIIRCCISHPVARSKSRPGRSLLIQLRVYKRRVRRNVRARQIHDTDSADVSALHAHGGYFPSDRILQER